MANDAVAVPRTTTYTKLNRQQITGFWGAWAGWTLDGMDSVIYALVLSPALTELLPKSGIKATPATVGYAGSVLFALFLVGWGLSLIWGPIADKFGRTRVLAATIFVYAIFTGAAAMSQTVWQLGLFRLLAGIGIGGEWALAGTYVAEAWPEDRRKMGAGYLQTGYYAGFFLASALNYTVGAHFGWRYHVLVRPDAGSCGFHDPVPGEGASALGTKGQGEGHGRAFFSAQDIQSSLHAAHSGEYGVAGCGHLRLMGGRGICADGDHCSGEEGRNVAAAGRAHVVLRHGTAVFGNHPRLPCRAASRRKVWP